MTFNVENIASAHILGDLALSPDGSKIVYRVAPAYKTGDHTTAALWYSPDTTKAGSAKQLTSGLYNDEAPAWHPVAERNTIFFLSNRHKQEGPKQIYSYLLDGPGEPSLISDVFKEKKREIRFFRVSPDGLYIAFCSADEPSQEEERKEKEKDDPRVWGDNKGLSRLRLFTISTREIRTLIEDKKHVASCSWSPDSKELLYFLSERSDMEAKYESTSLHIVSIQPSSAPRTRHVTTFRQAPKGDAIWPSSARQDFYTLQPYVPDNIVDALAVHCHSLKASSPENQIFYIGESEDAFSLLNLFSEGGEFVVGVASGLDTQIDILNNNGRVFTLFKTDREGTRIFDVKKVKDKYVLACIRSSGPNKEGPDVWVEETREKQSLTLRTKLSSHYPWVANSKLGKVELFEWMGEDGVPLKGMAWFPQGIDPCDVKTPLPTILHIHGGPYYRDTPELSIYYVDWQPILAEQGYLVLSPNYRGSAGRGHGFARAAYHAMGTIEWSDVNGMVDEAIKRGLADKSKLGIGGWSQGGFLTAWGVSQTKNKFRCGIMGAGVSDWGSMATESDIPDFQTELGGSAPWLGATATLTGDPIRHLKGVETAMLIIHGECDARVPVGQAIGFHRGLRRMSRYPERHVMVVYPREEHGFKERKHVEDVIKRVIGHYEAWLK